MSLFGLVLFTLVLTAVLFDVQTAAAAEPPPDAACKGCHLDNDGEILLPSGEVLQLGVDIAVLDSSVHGGHEAVNVYCTDCHRSEERYRFPHQPNPAETLQEFAADVAQNCQRCHEPIEVHNPGHLGASDDAQIPTCTDCHGGHDVAPAAAMAADPIGTCQSCHQDFEHEQVARAHADLAANLGPDQTCETCHNGEPVYPADAQCKTCHTLLSSQVTLASGETVELNVDLETLNNSVHGYHQIEEYHYTPLLCTDCHQDQERYGFPHEPITAPDLLNLRLEMDDTCQQCHTEIAEDQHDSVHGMAQEEGSLVAATCTDCHGFHDIQVPDEPRERISQTCAKCHSTINEQYEHSVHGEALLGEHNPDVPVCTNCHGVHNIPDPTTATFRINSPQMCGECHADEEMMARYDISTDVFETYVADFHGTTVQLFEKQSPEHETNKAVCYDCHGIHNILPASDENSQVIRENLLETCRQCHPTADANFPDSWTSHFKPSLEHNTLVYLVNLFYQILIPAVLGGFALFIGTDVYRMARKRGSKEDHHGDVS